MAGRVLQDWLGTIAVDDFRARQLQHTPVAQSSTVADPASLLDWARVGGVLRSRRADVLVVARGDLLGLPAPCELDELRAYLRIGVGLCIRHAERADAALADLAAQFVRDLGDAQVQLFVTPAGTHGFGWHYDDEDVFIAQTEGIKDYYFRANTVTASAAHPSQFGSFAQETAPLMTATLHAGDFLYIPARWWHMAICKETSLSVSVGVYPTRRA